MDDTEIYDFIVVGSGPASFSFCYSLVQSKPDANILVIEAGRKDAKKIKNEEQITSIGQDFNLDPTLYTGYGGTSNLWHNVIAPMDAEDFQKKEWIPGSGWPIEKADLERSYNLVGNIFKIDTKYFEKDYSLEFFKNELSIIEYDQEVFEPKFFLQPKKKFRAQEHFEKLKDISNISFVFETTVLELVHSNGFIEHLKCGQNGMIKKFKARNFVLCAGTINTTKIILNSNFEAFSEMDIGSNLLDHPMGTIAQMKYAKSRKAGIYSAIPLDDSSTIKCALKFTPEKQKKLRIPNSAFYLRPSFHEGVNNDTEKVKLKLIAIRDKLINFKIPIQESLAIVSDFNLARQVLEYKFGLNSSHKFIDFSLISEQTPNRLSKVSLSNKLDQYGYKQIEVNWKVDELDMKFNDQYIEAFNSSIVGRNNAKLIYSLDHNKWKNRLSSAAHHLGTLKMGNDPKSSFVNKNLKCHAIANLYIGDGSVFPTAGNANSTFTIMALAHRLGEYLGK